MFDNLKNKLFSVIEKLNNRGIITEEDLNKATREIRIALLEADVSLPVIKKFISNLTEKFVGEKVTAKVSAGNYIMKLVQDELEEILGKGEHGINFSNKKPDVILLAGLQGAGKTTVCAKLATFLRKKHKKNIAVVSLDVYRPAAEEQLSRLAKEVSLDIFKPETNNVLEKAKLAFLEAKNNNFDAIIFDTAGRLYTDQAMMDELKSLHKEFSPVETLLVTDALTGQEAVNIASEFNNNLPLTGIILTRLDSDARGGAALSMKEATNCPIKFMGTGEKISDFAVFDAKRIASQILGMGDIVGLVEKAQEVIDQKEAEKLAEKLAKGQFDLNDMASQIKQLKKFGGIGSFLGFIPGMGKIKDMLEKSEFDEKIFDKQLAIISSMTKKERRNPNILNGSRRLRIAKGSGVKVEDVNILIKQYTKMKEMFSKMRNMDFSNLSKMKNFFNNK